jgi:anti-sigma factor RsiW
MNPGVHQNEDTLLDYAYGELPAHEAAAIDAHVRTCAKCSQTLAQIRGVRSVFAPLPMEAAPEAGLESLLAYAEQHAHRTKAPKQAVWRRWIFALSSAAALVVVGVVATRAIEEAPQSPADVLERNAKEAAAEQRAKETRQVVAAVPQASPAEALDAPRAPVPQAAAGGKLEEGTDEYVGDKKVSGALAQKARKNMPLTTAPATKTAAAEKTADKAEGDVNTAEANAYRGGARQSESKRGLNSVWKEDSNAVGSRLQDFSNSGSGLGRQEREAVPKPEPAKDRLSNLDDALSDGTSARQSAFGGTASSPGFGVATGSTAPAQEPPAPRPAPPPPAPVVVQPSAPAVKDAVVQSAPAKKAKSSYGLPMPQRSAPSADRDEVMADSESSATSERQRRVQEVEAAKALLERARRLASAGDRAGEVKASLEALNAGASGYERVEALKRVCDGYEAMGSFDRAELFCARLLSEFPGTAAAQQIVSRRRAVEENAKKAPAKTAPAAVDQAAPTSVK